MLNAKILTPILLFSLCQCMSGPAMSEHQISPGAGAVLAYQNSNGISLSLVNRSQLSLDEGREARQKDPQLKIIPDSEVQYLINKLDSLKFFEMAAPQKTAGARHWVTMMHKGKTYVVSNNVTRDAEAASRFMNCMTAFNDTYSSNDNFSGSSVSTRELEKQSQEVRRDTQSIDKDRSRIRRGTNK